MSEVPLYAVFKVEPCLSLFGRARTLAGTPMARKMARSLQAPSRFPRNRTASIDTSGLGYAVFKVKPCLSLFGPERETTGYEPLERTLAGTPMARRMAGSSSSSLLLSSLELSDTKVYEPQIRTLLGWQGLQPRTHSRMLEHPTASYRGTSLIRNRADLGPYSRALWWSYGGGLFLIPEVPLYLNVGL